MHCRNHSAIRCLASSPSVRRTRGLSPWAESGAVYPFIRVMLDCLPYPAPEHLPLPRLLGCCPPVPWEQPGACALPSLRLRTQYVAALVEQP
eukprot:gene12890-biopygen3888